MIAKGGASEPSAPVRRCKPPIAFDHVRSVHRHEQVRRRDGQDQQSAWKQMYQEPQAVWDM